MFIPQTGWRRSTPARTGTPRPSTGETMTRCLRYQSRLPRARVPPTRWCFQTCWARSGKFCLYLKYSEDLSRLFHDWRPRMMKRTWTIQRMVQPSPRKGEKRRRKQMKREEKNLRQEGETWNLCLCLLLYRSNQVPYYTKYRAHLNVRRTHINV